MTKKQQKNTEKYLYWNWRQKKKDKHIYTKTQQNDNKKSSKMKTEKPILREMITVSQWWDVSVADDWCLSWGCEDVYLSAASLDAPRGCRPQSQVPDPGIALCPARRDWPRPCWTYESPHSSDWTHLLSRSTILWRGPRSTRGGLEKRKGQMQFVFYYIYSIDCIILKEATACFCFMINCKNV